MSKAVYEFPLKEKVRNYLRVEHLMTQLKLGAESKNAGLQLYFFEQLFTLLDLIERIDIRTDVIKDLDAHERNLVYWSQHPNIDNNALQQTLQSILRVRNELKGCKKIGADLKDDKFLSAIRQRFAIPGGTCSFDLPNLHYWMHQDVNQRNADIQSWLSPYTLMEDAIAITLSFLRERGRFTNVIAENGFYQGVAGDKSELIRIRCETAVPYYPTLSGNKYRYALRFMRFNQSPGQSPAMAENIQFEIAAC
jgi:cell division protein ZapD